MPLKVVSCQRLQNHHKIQQMTSSSGKISGFSTLGVADICRKPCDLRSKTQISPHPGSGNNYPVAVCSCSGQGFPYFEAAKQIPTKTLLLKPYLLFEGTTRSGKPLALWGFVCVKALDSRVRITSSPYKFQNASKTRIPPKFPTKCKIHSPEGPARYLDVSRQKLSPHCLETIFDSQLPSPKLSPKMPPKLSLAHKRGHLFLFQNYPRSEGSCETTETATSRCLFWPTGSPDPKKYRKIPNNYSESAIFVDFFSVIFPFWVWVAGGEFCIFLGDFRCGGVLDSVRA